MKMILSITIVLLLAVALTTFGLAADQTVTVNIPPISILTLSTNDATITFPSFDAETYTANSNSFNVITQHNGSENPDVQVSSTALTNTNGAALDLSQFIVYLTPQNMSQASGALDQPVTIENIGRGRKTATAYYGLTIDAEQQAGTYTGTVTFTLVNQ